MKRLRLLAGISLVLLAGPAAAQYGPGGGGMQTGVVDRPQDDDDAKIGVDDGSGIIQGRTDITKKKAKKKKDPSCHEEKKDGYRVSNCW